MGTVDFDPDTTFRALESVMVDRLDEIGQVSVAHARRIAPRKTGRGARSITYLVDAATMTVRFGTELLYMRFKEIGTWKMAPHSFLRRTGIELIDKYKRIVAGKE